MKARVAGATVVALTLAASSCSPGGDDPPAEAAEADGPAPSVSTTDSVGAGPTTTEPTTTTTDPRKPARDSGVPIAADDPQDLARQIQQAEEAVLDPTTDLDTLQLMAHQQQVVYRKLSRHPEWLGDVLGIVSANLHPSVLANVAARREFLAMHTELSDLVPAWEIIDPLPAGLLLSHYQEAERAYGVEWEYLAAINLVETGMGRIRGLSSAGAQGPMQFMPATWEAVGEGDVNDPRDAILAAARYLVQRGAPDDMDAALWGYNNHDNYVRAVKWYASLMMMEPRYYEAFHGWEIYYLSSAGDLYLPIGFKASEPLPVSDYLADFPEAYSDTTIGPAPGAD